MKSGIAREKVAFNMKLVFISKVEFNLRKKILQRYFFFGGGGTLCGTENWRLRKVDQQYLGRF